MPIFIVGVHRSGTTLLRYMLNSHPDIYIPPESDFIPRFFLRNPDKEISVHDVDRKLQIIFSKYRFVREWKGQPPNITIFNDYEKTPNGFLTCIYQLYAKQYNAHRWGDKTPIYCSYIPLIDSIFPDAQFIHIIRDGRDVALSMLEKWGKRDFHIDIYFTAKNWVRRISQARQEGMPLGRERYLEIHYENLVENPKRELIKVCTFLGERYFPAMSEPHILGESDIEPGSFHDSIRNPPSTKRINRWKEGLSSSDLHIFEFIAGDLLVELGYPTLNSHRLSSAEQVRRYLFNIKYNFLQFSRSILQKFRLVPPI